MMNLYLIHNTPTNLEALVSWGINFLKGNSLRVSHCKLAWWETIYYLWIQPQGRVH